MWLKGVPYLYSVSNMRSRFAIVYSRDLSSLYKRTHYIQHIMVACSTVSPTSYSNCSPQLLSEVRRPTLGEWRPCVVQLSIEPPCFFNAMRSMSHCSSSARFHKLSSVCMDFRIGTCSLGLGTLSYKVAHGKRSNKEPACRLLLQFPCTRSS